MSEPTSISFEAGYRRLQEIAEEVNQAEVPVDRLADLFAEGKGLDKALTDHLGHQKTRIESIERGEEIQAFKIVSASERDDTAADAVDFEVAPSGAGVSPQSPSGSGDDDIPF